MLHQNKPSCIDLSLVCCWKLHGIVEVDWRPEVKSLVKILSNRILYVIKHDWWRDVFPLWRKCYLFLLVYVWENFCVCVCVSVCVSVDVHGTVWMRCACGVVYLFIYLSVWFFFNLEKVDYKFFENTEFILLNLPYFYIFFRGKGWLYILSVLHFPFSESEK